eukprot:CAMPEP_0119267406 /NCGR_PEP_ID=MMETSP1329-20130426/5558_1 /TAXON_ID=114041 /ORGANISM="Genus nov. species nov., Strain RCC1024" /LENGTH=333 /DNA_ID=CAMNT_0007267329 /DNA_START=89 /DNA_END=1090 /DNA_ORIENTATION=-
MKLILALALSGAAVEAFVKGPAARRPQLAKRFDAESDAVEADIAEAAAEPEAPAVEAVEAKPERKSKKDAIPLAELVVGQEYEGKVTGVAAYGAFVDLGAAADGLVHISELSDKFVDDVAAVVKEGDAVKVRVLKIDEEKKQLGLSMKPEGSGPPPRKRERRPKKAGAAELRKYLDADPQEFIPGTVRTVLAWGAFVNIAEGVDGLVHVSRVSDERVENLEEVLSVGQEVQVRVEGVDLDKLTVALAMNTYREPSAPRAPRPDAGESAAAGRARNPDAKFGGQQKPRRRDPGDDIWDNTDSFDWKDVLESAGDEDDLASGIKICAETGEVQLA